MSSLTDSFIADTYGSVLHADLHTLSASSQVPIYDGAGNKSSLTLAKDGAGVSITGALTAAGIRYPQEVPVPNDIMVALTPNHLTFKSLGELISSIGGFSGDGVYENPTLTFTDGVITDIQSNATGGLKAYDTPGNFVFDVPDKVRKLKFTITGGGGGGGGSTNEQTNGGAGGTVIGYMPINPGQFIHVSVGHRGTTANNNRSGDSSKIIAPNGETLAEAYGGNTTYVNNSIGEDILYGGGSGAVSSSQVTSYTVINGGCGGVETDDPSSGAIGAASYWGSGPAPGGGQGASSGQPIGQAGNGYVLFEW